MFCEEESDTAVVSSKGVDERMIDNLQAEPAIRIDSPESFDADMELAIVELSKGLKAISTYMSARKDMASADILPPKAFEADAVPEGQVLFACGSDRRLRPTLIARPCMHQASSEEESLKAVKGCMDTVRQTFDRLPSGEEQIVVLYDLGGAGYSNFDMTFTRQMMEGLLNEFPDRLEAVFVINGHWTISAAWSTIRAFLHPDTREKIVFYGSDYRAKLLDHIGAEHPYLEYLQE